MKLITWNVNGLRACVEKGFLDFLSKEDPDMIALQETKMQREQAQIPLPGYHEYWNSAVKKGYSGTAIFTKHEPLSVKYGLDSDDGLDAEGRVITLEYPDFWFVTAYVPNSQDELKRLDVRMRWEDTLRAHLIGLDKSKPVIYCGDLNVAHEEIDLKNPASNHKNAGFSDEERNKMTELLSAGFADAFRRLYPDTVAYSWYSYRFRAREKGIGWRIDYFIVSERYLPRVRSCSIDQNAFGSDHLPVTLLTED